MKAALPLIGEREASRRCSSPLEERRDEGSSDLEEILADGDGP
jgi:hypothetical protein